LALIVNVKVGIKFAMADGVTVMIGGTGVNVYVGGGLMIGSG